jgi:hypothetical protein
LEDLGIEGMLILKWILRKQDVKENFLPDLAGITFQDNHFVDKAGYYFNSEILQ